MGWVVGALIMKPLVIRLTMEINARMCQCVCMWQGLKAISSCGAPYSLFATYARVLATVWQMVCHLLIGVRMVLPNRKYNC